MKENSKNSNRFTQVKTVYARAALLLMAVNLFMTGYVVTRLAELSNPEQEPVQTESVTTTSSNQR